MKFAGIGILEAETAMTHKQLDSHRVSLEDTHDLAPFDDYDDADEDLHSQAYVQNSARTHGSYHAGDGGHFHERTPMVC